MKSKLVKNFIVLFISLLLIEFILRLVLGFNIIGWQILRIFITTSILSLFFSLLISLMSNKINKYFNMCIVFASSLYAIVQIGLYNFIGVFFSLNSSSQVEKITDYVFDYIKGYSWNYYLVFIPFILVVLYYILINKKIDKVFVNSCKKNYIIGTIILIVLGGMFYATLKLDFMQNKYQSESNIEVIKYGDNPNLAVNQFGINAYAFIDLVSLFTDEELINNINNTNNNQDDIIETDNNRYIDDENWLDIISKEKNKTYNQINNYLINRNITKKNEKTGLFENKNIIAILLESVNNIPFLYTEYFPTLNKLYNEGMTWENNYTSRNSCSTGNNEMVFLTGLYTINNTCTANAYRNNTYMTSMFNLFNEAGYYTSSYHNYGDYYYYRKTIHKNMGSNKYYNGYDLGIKVNRAYEEWPSDVELISESIDKYINEEKFFTFYSTVTTHRPYTVSSEYGDKHLDLFEDLDLSKSSKRYLSKMIELDNALKLLLEELENSGKLDDTVIVLFGDHYPYGLSNSQLEDFLGSEVLEDYERDRLPFIIYNNATQAEKYSDYTSIINALPTIANLFNLDFDPRYYMGTDLFSEDYVSRVLFDDGSWRDENIMYKTSTNDIKYYNDVEVIDEEIVQFNERVNNDIKISNLIIRNNYFNYLKNKLDSYVTNEIDNEESEE